MAMVVCRGEVMADFHVHLHTHRRVYRELLNVGNASWRGSREAVLYGQLLVQLGNFCGGEADIATCASLVREVELELPSWAICRSEDSLLDGALWIVKPVAQACGRDIRVVRGLGDLLRSVQSLGFKCVVQKYIERPLLVRRDRKFDIRQWVLVTCANPLVVYGFSQCYIRLSGRAYTADRTQLGDANVHLCNHSVNRDFERTERDGGEEWTSSTMMSQQEFALHLDSGSLPELLALPTRESTRECGVFRQHILPQIRSQCIKAICACREKFSQVGRGFEWLGMDLMVTEGGDVLLLEVNTSPDTSMSTVVTTRLVEAATRDLFDLILDEGAVSSPATSLSAAEKAYRTGSPRWDVVVGVAGDGAADITRKDPHGCDPPQSIQERPPTTVESPESSEELIWQLWYVGRQEAKRDLEKLNSKKVEKLGALYCNQSSKHSPERSEAAETEGKLFLIGNVTNILCSECEGCASQEDSEEEI